MARAMTTPSTSQIVQQALRGKGTGRGGLVFEAMLLVALLASLGILVALLADVLAGGWSVLTGRGWDFVRGPLTLDEQTAGVWSGIVGSLLLSLIVAVVAFPVGVGAAVYLEEYAHDNAVTRFITTNIRNLAGVPSIVFGLLGLTIFVRVVDTLDGAAYNGRSVVAAGLTLAVLVLPITIITASEALRAVPDSIREAGLAVGATRWEVTRHHVLPAAAPAILTGTVLTLARAFGETAPLLLVGVATGLLITPANAGVLDSLLGPYTALPIQVFSYSRDPRLVEHIAPAAIVVLLVVLLSVNAAAIILRNRYERKW